MSSCSTQKWKCPACGATHDSPFASCPDCGSPKVGTPFYYCDIHGDLTGSVCSSCLRAEKRADKLACAKREAMAGGDWCHALALCDELDAERPGDPDVASVRRKAQAEGARIEREERKEAARRVAEAERLAREERERLACEEEARRQAARIKARWRKRIIFLALGLLIWVVVFWGIPAKRKADYRNALHAKDYAEVARICKKLAPKWRPAVNYLEYWGARQALEAALKEADPVVYRKAGGETWAEMETQKQLGEECVLYSYRYLEGKAAYVAAQAKFNEVKAVVDRDVAFRAGIKEDGESVVRNLHGLKSAAVCLDSFPASRRGDWKRAADAGMPEGQWLWGLCCMVGGGGERNPEHALDFFTKAANQKLPIAALYAYLSFLAKGDTPKAMSWCRIAAEGGEPLAQLDLGVCYLKGDGVPHDEGEAVKWFEKAAEQGLVPAQNNIGVMYFYGGSGVVKDYGRALKWFRLAASKDWAPSQRFLAKMYWDGLEVAQDKQEAVKWYSKAAANGDAEAQNNLGHAYLMGDGVDRDYAEAFKWLSQAAKNGSPNAQCSLGVMYFEGAGVQQNQQIAAQWYAQAAQQGLAAAQRNLGIMYNNGWGVAKNSKEAVKWFRLAAKQGDEVAAENLRDLNVRR
jgi:uncharacterized protein